MRRREVIAGMLAAMGGNSARGQSALDELRIDARAVGFDLSDQNSRPSRRTLPIS
jgi:hypothetical protein